MLVGARWLHFAAMYLLFGGSLFPFYAGPPAASDLPWSAGRLTRLLRCAAVLAAASGLAWLAGTAAMVAGGLAAMLTPGFLPVFFLATPFGPVELARLVLLVGLLGAAFLPRAAQLRFALLATVAGALLVSQAWLGHAAEGGDTPAGWAMVASYASHVLAGAAWIGGLPPLLLALTERRRPDPGRTALALLLRFSAMAMASAAVVVVSGAANTAFRFGAEAGALATTAYGRVLLVKLALVAAVLGFAAVTRFVVMPRLRARAAPLDMPARLGLTAELCFGALVLAAAAVLGITPPPR